jgi:LacI family transcriptional regulator, galactose operon repressor
MKKDLTMAKIAEELELSRATVSAVINGRERKQRISPKTAEIVKKYMLQHGYVQPKSAIQLRKGTPDNLTGVLYCGDFIRFPHLIHAFSILTNHIKSKYGFVDITGVDPANQHDALKDQVAKGTKNLIWIHSNIPEVEMENAEALFPLLERMERVIVFNYDFRNPKWDSEYLKRGIHLLGYDRFKAYSQAAELFEQEKRTHLGMPEFFLGSNISLPGVGPFKDIFESKGIKILGAHPPLNMISDKLEISKVFAENMARLHKEQGLDCAFIRRDILCAEIMVHLSGYGIRVPADIAIIGFGDMPYMGLLPVPLTTFKLPVETLSRKAIDLLDKKNIEKGQSIKLNCELILRSSHGKSKSHKFLKSKGKERK